MATTQTASRWLFGPLPDLLLGCGGAYLVVFLLLAGASGPIQTALPLGLLPLLVLVTSIPHYGATLLRVYEREGELRRYRVFAVWLTLLVYAWFVVGVYDRGVGSVMLTLYLTWSPWHYSGQNYGIALMFLGRRGVVLSAPAKRWFYASFFLSFALAFLGIHTAGSVDSYAPGSLGPDAYQTIRLGIPPLVSAWLLVFVTTGYGVSLAVAFASMSRSAPLRDLAPVVALVALQGLWFSLPVLSRATGWLDGLAPLSGDGMQSEYAFLWVAMGHAVQYLWVTSYYARHSDERAGHAGYLLKALGAGGAAFGLPLLFFGPDLFGVRGYDAGLALLIASAVNLHHFILDGAIWKLRDGRIARVLLRDGEDAGAGSEVSGATGRLVRRLALVAGLVYAVSFAYGTLEYEFGVRRPTEAGDFDRMRAAASRLRWIGRDDAGLRYNLAVGAFRDGDVEVAVRDLERSFALQETARSWTLLGVTRERSGDPGAALDAYARALELEPDHVPALVRSAALFSRRGERPAAAERLRRALELEPGRTDLRERLSALEATP